VVTSAIDIVAFRLGTRYFGIPVAQVDRVIRVVEITPLSGAPELIRGFVTVEAAVVPVVDLGRRSEGHWSKLDLQQRLILAHEASRRFALLADDVDGVTRVPESALSDRDAASADGFIYTNLCDITKLLDAAEEAQLEGALQSCAS
jgi:chemotaxis signal transduction protein